MRHFLSVTFNHYPIRFYLFSSCSIAVGVKSHPDGSRYWYIVPRYWLAPNVGDAVDETSDTSVVIKNPRNRVRELDALETEWTVYCRGLK